MATANSAPLNPKVLAWARTEGGWQPEQVAKKLQVKPEQVIAWERGDLKPTFRQAENLARVLHRPLSIFFQPHPPDLPPLAAEYRRLPGVEVGAESPELRLAIRQMLNRRAIALELLEELGEEVTPFNLVAHLDEEAAIVGARLRQRLGVSVDAQLQWPNEWHAWRAWRAAAENAGVLVFQFAKVALGEARGVSLLDWPLPVVGLNSKESVPEARSFTLLHELVHLMLAAGHEELPALHETRTAPQWEAVERFAEKAASHALVPEDALARVTAPRTRRDQEWSLVDMRNLARRFRITPLAMATRLRESGYMSWKRYHAWRDQWNQHVKMLRPRAGGFASPAERTLGRAGRPFVELVFEAMSNNSITSVDAARFLDLRYQHFEQLRELLSGPGERGAQDA
jgi:Zn-dependent peptidase ImmA (M78 family)/transcriptional regulator with XRE-family HTH domain